MTTLSSATPSDALSERDVLVLSLLAQNVSRRAIADRLGCSTATIDRRISGLRARWAVETTVEAVVHAVRAGLI